jgi:hypothetical protein
VRVECWLGPDAAAVLGRLQRHSGLTRGQVYLPTMRDAHLAGRQPSWLSRLAGSLWIGREPVTARR